MDDASPQNFRQRLNSDLYARFRIDSRVEILALLRALHEERNQIVLNFAGDQYIASRLLAAWPQHNRIVLDFGADEAINRAIIAAGHAVAETNLHQVSVQFEVGAMRSIALADGPALEAALPDCMLRLQRREAYRVPTPVLRPITLRVPAQVHCPRDVDMRVVDISSGGLGVVCEITEFRPEAGSVLDGCLLDLPEVGLVVADIEVRHVDCNLDANNVPHAQCGLRFLSLAPHMATFIQRYVMKLEREWRMLR